MNARTLTAALGLRDYDPLRDKSYRETAFGPHVVDWLAWLELAGRADRTLDQYERDLARVCTMYPTRSLDEFTDGDLSHVVRSWPKASRRVRKAALDSFFAWAVRQRRLDANPMDRLPVISRPGQRWYDVFSEVEVADLTTLPLIDGVLMVVLLDAGLRKSEACALQVRRLKLEPAPAELVLLAGKGGKDRVLPMSSRLAAVARDLLYLEQLGPQDHLWYMRPGGGPVNREKPIGEGSFARWWSRCLAAAGVRYRNPHMTRHTFATRWLRRGGRLETLSVAMGHKSIKTTFDLYGHLDTRDVAADLARLEAVEIF